MRIAPILLCLALCGCSALSQPSQQPLPTVVLGTGAGTAASTGTPSTASRASATASGKVVPARQVELAFGAQDRVKTVDAAVGDRVKAGQVLATLEDAALRAQIQQAQAAVASAQASYDLLAAGPTPGQIRAAEAAVLAATANYSRTVGGARKSDVAAAQAALASSIAAYDRVKAGPRAQDYAAAEAALRNAEAALRQAQTAYDAAYKQNPAAIGASPAALALEQATNNYAAARATLDRASAAPDAADVSAAYQAVQSARAALDATLNPARDFDLVQAQAQLDGARAELDAIKSGPRSQQLDAARAQVDAAKAAQTVLEAQLRARSIVAPFEGTVVVRGIEPGELAGPAATAMVLADLDRLRVETSDLSERDVPKVEVGQSVSVNLRPLGQTISGKVAEIAPRADIIGGDVVYRTLIDLDTRPAGLRSGMTADVQFGTARP